MDCDELTTQLQSLGTLREQRDGFWNLDYEERTVLVVTSRPDRLRIMTPVLPAEDLQVDVLFQVLQSNFSRTLLCRYALHGDFLWAVFQQTFHLIKAADLELAIQQVVLLADTFGTSFSATIEQLDDSPVPLDLD